MIDVTCQINRQGARPEPSGDLLDSVLGLVQSVKEYERLTIRATPENSRELAKLALLAYPLVGQWRKASELMVSLIVSDQEFLGYL